jgi:hypothetical protein
MEQPTRTRAFQSPFKLSASRTSAREAIDKKDSNSNIIKKKEDELFPNALETETNFKVACSVAALLMFFHDKDFKGNTSRGDAFRDCDKYRPVPLSYMWQKILLKQPAEKQSIALHSILIHQEVRRRLTVLCFADPVGRLLLVAAGFENSAAASGGASQDVTVQALVCSSAVSGTMCRKVVSSFIHLIRSLVWGCGRDQSFVARVGRIHLQLRCEHPCPSMRKAIQYYDMGLSGLLGGNTTCPAGRCKSG